MVEFIASHWQDALYTILCLAVGFLFAQMKSLIAQNKANIEGTKALLKAMIEKDCNAITDRGYIEKGEYDEIKHMYDCYVALGNGSPELGIKVLNLQNAKQERRA